MRASTGGSGGGVRGVGGAVVTVMVEAHSAKVQHLLAVFQVMLQGAPSTPPRPPRVRTCVL